jgi:predicted Zn-dependent protease
VKWSPLSLALLLFAGAGCTIEPFSSPVPVPASYAPDGYKPYSTTATTLAVAATQPATAPAVTQAQPQIDDRTVEQALAATRAHVLNRFGVDNDPQLNEYLLLVGSLVTINTPRPDVEYAYVLLNTDQPVSCAVWPKTVCVSRGLLKEMQDESELAGVIAREISNLISARALKAANLPIPSSATTRPATQMSAPSPVASRIASRLTDLLVKDGLPPDLEQAADLEGAQFAAAAKYAPDGFLRLLTRRQPARSASSTQPGALWERIKTLDANVKIIAKAYPASDARLPARFETYLKAAPVKP